MAMTLSPSAAIDADASKIAKVVLFPGDPLRAKAVAEDFLQDAELFNNVRNMLGYTGIYKGNRISIMGSGMGIPSATLYAHELYNFYGVETIIRMGTAGALSEDVRLRQLIIAMTASTNSNFSAQYNFPGILSPCADYEVLTRAVTAAREVGAVAKVGGVYTADMYYNADAEADRQCRRFGLLAVDMETAGLYWEAMASKRRALSILSVSNHLITGEGLSAQERQDSFREMMEVALETAWHFA